MYIVVLYTTKGRMYFNGTYYNGVYTAKETYDRNKATQLSVVQADEVGRYYARMHGCDFDLERIR
jgi:hypothetical protein